MSTSNPMTPNTIVLIHGLWMTALSWEHWMERYKTRGFKVLAPAYPGLEVEVADYALDWALHPVGMTL